MAGPEAIKGREMKFEGSTLLRDQAIRAGVCIVLRVAAAATAVLLSLGLATKSAAAAPTCNVSASQSGVFAPANIKLDVTSVADNPKGGPIVVWLDVDYRHSGSIPTPVAQGTPTGLTYHTVLRVADAGIHHVWVTCGSGTGNTVAQADVVLFNPALVAVAIGAMLVLLVLIGINLRLRRQASPSS
jgi:hypothetical protein